MSPLSRKIFKIYFATLATSAGIPFCTEIEIAIVTSLGIGTGIGIGRH
jgi:hypothetical protein